MSPVMGGARRRQWPINWCRTTAPSVRPSASTHDCAHPIHHPPRPPTPIPDSSGPSFVFLASHKTAVDVYCYYVVSSRLFGPGKLRCVLQSYIRYSCTRVHRDYSLATHPGSFFSHGSQVFFRARTVGRSAHGATDSAIADGGSNCSRKGGGNAGWDYASVG